MYAGLLSNSFLLILVTFFQISLYFSNTFSSFIKKRHRFSFIKISCISLIFGRNMDKGLIFFSIFIANKTFKIIFTKRDLIRYYYFINIYIMYGNRAFILVKFVFFNLMVYKCFTIFLNYSFSLFFI